MQLSYYNIPKSAIIDYPHSYGGSYPNSFDANADGAGATIEKSASVSTGSHKSMIDYAGDIDWYEFTCSPGTYVLTTTAASGMDIDLRFYNSAGTLLTVEENTGNVNKTVVLVGTKYYMRVCNKNSSVTGTYTLNING